ncbi:ABC transporter permease [Nocardia amamiensis]|uniref:ABC transporter permease n=1 Tax=Nocardia amamiensis TaxID=404578 RepID=A0ABS0CXY6_9NOCA|nr:ABC transporter permease [Nocardia amamiensis]MBF6301010.1 ABC transporter permease [Nocardia amamiensis]
MTALLLDETRSSDRGGRWSRVGLWVAVGILGVLVLMSILAPVVAPYSPTDQDLTSRFAGPSTVHLLGTDNFGRDVLSRLIWGGRSSFAGVLIAVGAGLALGIPWGLGAGYGPRWFRTVLMRMADAFLAFPALVLAIAITGVLGPDLVTAMCSVGVVFAPVIARLTAGGVAEVRRREYVLSARMSGCPAHVILIRHVLPHAIGPVIIQAAVFAGLAFIIEAALSFIGLGIQPPAPSWGGDLNNAYQHILSAPGQVLAPGVLIAVAVLATYRIGDECRDLLSTPPV